MDFFEVTINSKNIYSGKILKLRLDEVKLPNGKTSTREIVEHPGAVAIVAIDDDGSVLMVRQYRKPVEEELLEIPAGKLEDNEDVRACAQRELIEETGYRAENLVHIIDFYTSPGFSNEKMSLFIGRNLKKAAGKADEDEYIKMEKIPFEQAVKMAYSGELKDAKTIVGLFLAYSYLRGEF
ncbi:NUDIX domain-containing protein [Thermosediminibacter litoriperuensis]|uniref:ADP-ribose pyrophosphatase n=1 Tax=Thermosediminibacter litoriperuensis TaxID=291989 RepID=A0A5S5ATB8_9FIRM|nr:NUDIX hydrolase [Thermosediminibacter litoriperuensis]TYP54256.1 ADP-ribose pyrophosphatase [Thermosediminibacter litoriperuensis]